jgi:hypothetical protein
MGFAGVADAIRRLRSVVGQYHHAGAPDIAIEVDPFSCAKRRQR